MAKAPARLWQLKGDAVEELFYNSKVNSRNEDVQAQYALYVNDQHVPKRVRLADIGTKFFPGEIQAKQFQIKQLEDRIAVLQDDIDVIQNGRDIPESDDFDESDQTHIDDLINEGQAH